MKLKLVTLCLLGSLFLIACSSEDDDNKPVAETSGPTLFSGYVTQVGNGTITVSDGTTAVTYTVDANTNIKSNSSGAANSGGIPLQPGMIVDVVASDGVATSVTYDTVVEGAVVSNSIQEDNSGEMDVMGQIVVVDDMTRYGGDISHASVIAVGDMIEVSGIVMEDGRILAKFIEPKTDNNFQIEGAVSAVDGTPASSFNIRDCKVNITTDTVLDGLVIDDIVDGVLLEVTVAMEMASVDATTSLTCPVDAASIELIEQPVTEPMPNPSSPGDGGSASVDMTTIEGMASAAPDANGDFSVSDAAGALTNVMVTDATLYRGGGLADIVAGTPLVVSGTVDATTGVLTALEIIIRPMDMPQPEMVKIEGEAIDAPVAVDSGGLSFGIVNADGNTTTVMISDLTMIGGGTAGDIIAGTRLFVKGYLVDPDVLNAEVIEILPVKIAGMADAAPVDMMFNVASMDGVIIEKVVYSDATVFEGGTAADIVAGTPLVVVGLKNADGNLAARVIVLDIAKTTPMPDPTLQLVVLSGTLEAVDVDPVDPTSGSVTVMGVQVMVTADTKITGVQTTTPPMGGGTAPGGMLTIPFAELGVGVYAAIGATQDADGIITAHLIAVEPPAQQDNVVSGMAMVTAIDGVATPSIVVAGVNILTNSATILPMDPASDPAAPTPITDLMLLNGTEIVAIGTYGADGLSASEIKFVLTGSGSASNTGTVGGM